MHPRFNSGFTPGQTQGRPSPARGVSARKTGRSPASALHRGLMEAEALEVGNREAKGVTAR